MGQQNKNGSLEKTTNIPIFYNPQGNVYMKNHPLEVGY
jgi:hypothetical protein